MKIPAGKPAFRLCFAVMPIIAAVQLFAADKAAAASGPPSITTQPQNQTNLLGSNAVFTVSAGGSTPLHYRWSFNGTNLTNSTHLGGATNATLTISNIAAGDAGNYRVGITNIRGGVLSSNATLTVLFPAAITGQPASQTNYLGSTVAFSVSATGTAPLNYRWYFGGVPLTDGGQISGPATATLTIASIQGTNLGNYQVVVTNNYGAVTSIVATLNATNRVRCVNAASSNPVAPYTDWSTAAVNIQDAVSVSVAGDSVLVTNGYYLPGGVITITIPISVAGVSGPAQTIIDGGGANRCVYLGSGAMLTGFTLTNGYTTQDGGDAYCESTNEHIASCVLSGGRAGVVIQGVGGPGNGGGARGGTLTNCTLIANWSSQSGGGAFGSVLNNCIVASNTANGFQGGGVDQCTVLNSTLSGNWSGQWGGNASECTLTNCLLTGGSAFSGFGSGGGAYNSVLFGCTLSGNDGDMGGGARFCTLTSCTLSNNFAASNGGGADSSGLFNCLVVSNSSAQGGGVSSCTATNCVIQGNSMNDPYFGAGGGAIGGTLYNCLLTGNSSVRGAGGAEQSTLVNCTVAGNSASWDGGGVDYCTLTNCIVYFNTSSVTGNYSGSNYMNWCCTAPLPSLGAGDVVIGVSNLASAPVFVDAANGDFRLAVGSPCLSAGSFAAAPGAVDLIGNPRTINGTVDLGAYESPNPPFIAIQPTSQTVPFGQPSVAFAVVAIGQGVVTYQWQFNGTNILNATNSAFLLNFVQYTNAGAYSVIVTNSFGSVVSSNAVLTVVPPTPPSFVSQPTNQLITPVGSNITVTAQAAGAPAPAYQWYFNGAVLADNSHYTGTTSTNLQISNVQTNDTGNYLAIATNVGGAATSAVAAVTVFIPAAISLSPASQTLLQGSNVTFTAVASGSPPLGYQWLFNGNLLTDGGQFSGTATTNLTVTNLQATNAGNYVLVVTNNYSTATSTVAALAVAFPAAITLQPTNQTVLLGSNVTFAVTASGTTPLNYRWYANGVALASGGRISGATSTNLTIASAQASDAVSYQFVVTNNYSSATSQLAALTVLVPAQITGQPASQAVLLGSNATFTVTATGSGTLNYQWYFNGAALTDDGRISGSATPALNITNVQGGDAGGYVAVVTNSWGAATSRVASLTSQAVLAPSVRYVALTGTNPVPPYLDWSTAATNIQDAIDASVASDTVIVSNGFYNVGTRVVFGAATNRIVIDKAITVQSVNGPFATFIAGGGSNPQLQRSPVIRCAYLTNGAALIGFTLTNGGTISSTNIYLEASGGGVWCEGSSAVISNCVFVGNIAQQFGGGAFRGTLFGCLLTNNSASQGGGACSNALFNCTLIKNSASVKNSVNGGGGAVSSSLSNCLLVANTSVGYGGGAFLSLLNNCVLSNNVAVNGGGTYGGNIYSSLLSSNRASTGGGAYSNYLFNCLVKNNYSSGLGGGGYNSAFTSCTVVSNSAGSSGSSGCWGGTATNSIIYYNAAGGNIQDGRAVVYCCTTVSGTVTNPPLFVDLAGGDLHLQTNSPCINSGNNAYVAGATDFDGNPRIAGGTVDIGAYEFQSPASIISFAWLQQYGLPTDGTADKLDSDSDGFNNWQEWIAGTNPTNAASMLRMLAVTNANPAGLWVSWQTGARNYFVQRSTNLGSPFSTIASNIVGTGPSGMGVIWFADPTATNSVQYFYRVGVQ